MGQGPDGALRNIKSSVNNQLQVASVSAPAISFACENGDAFGCSTSVCAVTSTEANVLYIKNDNSSKNWIIQSLLRR